MPPELVERPRLAAPTGTVRASFLAGEREDAAEREDPTDWLDTAEADFATFVSSSRGTHVRWGVPATVWWYVSGEHYLGALVVRHELTPELEQVGGHVGFHLVPGWRRRGLAPGLLAAGLVKCRRLGIERALVTCRSDNLASRRVIVANGGQPDDRVLAGETELRFWIDVPAVRLRALTREDAVAHCDGEDAETVRWLTRDYGTIEGTADYFDLLALNAAAGEGKRGYGVWLGERLAGYVDRDPDAGDGLEPGDVNLTYAVHPWARGQGVAVDAVRAVCELLREQGLGSRAAIRVEPENLASVRVARAAGFTLVRDFTSATDTNADGSPAAMSLYVLPL